jgi:hypothetical protein
MKAKVFQVFIPAITSGTYLVEAQTKAGAIRGVIAHLDEQIRKAAAADLATGEQLYHAGKNGQDVIGSGRFKRAEDPNQMGLDGIPETAE